MGSMPLGGFLDHSCRTAQCCPGGGGGGAARIQPQTGAFRPQQEAQLTAQRPGRSIPAAAGWRTAPPPVSCRNFGLQRL